MMFLHKRRLTAVRANWKSREECLVASCGVGDNNSVIAALSFARTSLNDLPLLYDTIGGYFNILELLFSTFVYRARASWCNIKNF